MATKKVAVKKAVKVKEVEVAEVKKNVCSNCNDSGMTCNVCGVGRLQG